MRKIKYHFKRVYNNFYKINAVDRYLIIIMAILWIHCFFVLVFPRPFFGDMQNVDIVIRTSIASVFGYFLSADFLRIKRPPSLNYDTDIFEPTIEIMSESAINDSNKNELEKKLGYMKEKSNSYDDYLRKKNNLQIRLISFIGISSLLTLVLRRQLNLLIENPMETIGASAQSMRDLVAGSIGFLIGYVNEDET